MRLKKRRRPEPDLVRIWNHVDLLDDSKPELVCTLWLIAEIAAAYHTPFHRGNRAGLREAIAQYDGLPESEQVHVRYTVNLILDEFGIPCGRIPQWRKVYFYL